MVRQRLGSPSGMEVPRGLHANNNTDNSILHYDLVVLPDLLGSLAIDGAKIRYDKRTGVSTCSSWINDEFMFGNVNNVLSILRENSSD